MSTLQVKKNKRSPRLVAVNVLVHVLLAVLAVNRFRFQEKYYGI